MSIRYSPNSDLIDVSVILQIDENGNDSLKSKINILNTKTFKGEIDVTSFGGKYFINGSITIGKEFLPLVVEIEKEIESIKVNRKVTQ